MKKGFVKFLIPILIFAILAYIGIPILISHLRFLAIKDRAKEMAKFSRFYDRREMILKIIERANENNVKIDSSSISIWEEGGYTKIKFYYEDTIRYFTGHTIIRPHEVYVEEIPTFVSPKY
jgi:hypothetical protein